MLFPITQKPDGTIPKEYQPSQCNRPRRTSPKLRLLSSTPTDLDTLDQSNIIRWFKKLTQTTRLQRRTQLPQSLSREPICYIVGPKIRGHTNYTVDAKKCQCREAEEAILDLSDGFLCETSIQSRVKFEISGERRNVRRASQARRTDRGSRSVLFWCEVFSSTRNPGWG